MRHILPPMGDVTGRQRTRTSALFQGLVLAIVCELFPAAELFKTRISLHRRRWTLLGLINLDSSSIFEDSLPY